MRCLVFPGVVALVVAVLVLLSPQRTSQASWTDQSSAAGTLSTLSIAPTLTCVRDGRNATVSWTQPATPYGNAPVLYTATVQRNGGAKSPTTVAASGTGRSVAVVGTITLFDYPITVEVTSSLADTSWTSTTSLTGTVRGLLNDWRVDCP